MNIDDIWEVNMNVFSDRLMPAFGELNKRAISIEEEREAVNELKSCKVLASRSE